MTVVALDQSVFVLIDVQGKLVRLVHEADRLLEVSHRFLRLAEAFARPVVLTEQYPQGLGPTEPELLERFEQLETPKRRVSKDAFGCGAEPAFEEAVAELLPGIAASDRHYVVGGMETHICVMQTVLSLLGTGATVFVPFDCVSGRGEEYGRRALERMAQAGAIITNHESVGFELAGDKNHPAFKTLSNMLKAGQPGSASA